MKTRGYRKLLFIQENFDLLSLESGIKFDLIYAAGLYDYLPQRIAQALTQRLFELCNPGGKLLIPNVFQLTDAGYTESFMDWRLIVRNQSEMHELYAEIPEHQIEYVAAFTAPNNSIIFREIDKVCSAQPVNDTLESVRCSLRRDL